jgi:fructose/tagatose bisphosphate aldolase
MVRLHSIQKFYEKLAQNEIEQLTVPAFNIRVLTLDAAKALFRAAKKERAGAFLVEIARSEMEYTRQPPKEYASLIIKAAKEENFEGPLFLQGDHFKIKKEIFRQNKEEEIQMLEDLIKEALNNGFYNIDIDASSLPLQENAFYTAYFTGFIRDLKLPKPKETIAIGGEVGEIGGRNTTLEEFREFIITYQRHLREFGTDKGIIKIAVQTGTSHGGKLLPSGELAVMEEDFDVLREISQEAKKYGLAGAVQHGASTLPQDYFKKFPETGACEIHLATLFQNIVYDSEYFPADLKERIYQWVLNNYSDKKKEGENDKQLFYRFRKKAIGVFKEEIENIPQQSINKICEELEDKFQFFFRALNVAGTSELIKSIYL